MFILVIGSFPFSIANKKEFYFSKIYNRDWTSYWSTLLAKRPAYPVISDEFKDLIQNMFEYNFNRRITIEQIKEHPWYKGETLTYEAVFLEMKRRHEVNEEI